MCRSEKSAPPGYLVRRCPRPHDLALRYLLELSADIRGALLLDRDGRLLATAGHLPPDDLEAVGRRLADSARALSQNGRPRGRRR